MRLFLNGLPLDVDSISPATKDPWGNVRMATSASSIISTKDFGLTWNTALETGGVLVGDEVSIDLDVQFVKSRECGDISRATFSPKSAAPVNEGSPLIDGKHFDVVMTFATRWRRFDR